VRRLVHALWAADTTASTDPVTRLRLRFLAEQTARIDALDRQGRIVADGLTAQPDGCSSSPCSRPSLRHASSMRMNAIGPRQYAPLVASSGSNWPSLL
jgi:hypothetical protein